MCLLCSMSLFFFHRCESVMMLNIFWQNVSLQSMWTTVFIQHLLHASASLLLLTGGPSDIIKQFASSQHYLRIHGERDFTVQCGKLEHHGNVIFHRSGEAVNYPSQRDQVTATCGFDSTGHRFSDRTFFPSESAYSTFSLFNGSGKRIKHIQAPINIYLLIYYSWNKLENTDVVL